MTSNAEQALRDAASDRGPLFLYKDMATLREAVNAKLAGTGTTCGAIMVSNYERTVVGRFVDEGGEPYEVVLPELELAGNHEHAWPAELANDSVCENGCGLRYDQWMQPQKELFETATGHEFELPEGHPDHPDTPVETA